MNISVGNDARLGGQAALSQFQSRFGNPQPLALSRQRTDRSASGNGDPSAQRQAPKIAFSPETVSAETETQPD